MLGQGGLGLPNLAALGASGPPATLGFFQNANVVFAPIMIHQAAIGITPTFVVNQNRFFAPQLMYNQAIQMGFLQNVNRIRVPSLVWEQYRYTYPIGRYPDSDYGIRSSMTYYKRRLIIGRH